MVLMRMLMVLMRMLMVILLVLLLANPALEAAQHLLNRHPAVLHHLQRQL